MPSKAHRILHVIGATTAGGAERFVADLATRLSELGNEVSIFALSCRTDAAGAAMRETLQEKSIPVFTGPTVPVRTRSVLAYLRTLRKLNPEIVHLHTANTELAHALAGMLGRPASTTARTIHNTQSDPSRIYRWAYRSNGVSLSIACSDAVGKSAQALAIPARVIRNGILFDWPVQTPEEKRAARKRLGLSNERSHFVNIAAFLGARLASAQKAHDVLIESWKLALESRSHPAQLHLLGDGPLLEDARKLAGADESIAFWGVRDDVTDFLLAADAFVLPSRYEGLPIAAIEAIGTGLPCLFSDIAECRELDPPVAYWNRVDDRQQLSKNIVSLLNHLPDVEKHETERRRIEFGMQRTAAEYVEYYAELTGRQH